MKYMLIIRASDEAYEAFQNSGVPFEEVIESMGRFNAEMIDAGVLVAAEGLDDACRNERERSVLEHKLSELAAGR